MAESLMECCCSSMMSAMIPDGMRLLDSVWEKITGKRKKDNPYRETTVKFENHYDSLDDDDDDDDVDKPTFTVQPHSRNPLTTEDINAEKLSNKYSWTVRDKSHKASSMGNKNIAEWIDEQIKPLDGAKRGRNSQNWSTEGQESDAITGQDSGDSDTELLHS